MSGRRSRILAAIGCLGGTLLSVAYLAGFAGAASTARPRVPGVMQCTGKVQVRPGSYVLSCADANTMVEKIVWQSWTAKVATAHGVYSFNDCTPTCVAGKFHSDPAVLTLRNPVVTKHGWLFTRAVVVYRANSKRSVTVTQDLPRAPLTG